MKYAVRFHTSANSPALYLVIGYARKSQVMTDDLEKVAPFISYEAADEMARKWGGYVAQHPDRASIGPGLQTQATFPF